MEIEINDENLPVVIETLKGKGYQIRDNKQEEEFVSKLVGTKTGEFIGRIEKDVFDLTGVQKNEGEKYHEYYKRAFGEKSQAVDALKSEIEKIKREGSGSSDDKKRIQQLEDLIKVEKEKYSKELSEKDKKIFEKDAMFEIEKSMSDIRAKLRKDLPKSLVDTYERTEIKNLLGKSKFIEGKLVFLDDNGDPLLNKQTASFLTAQELLNEKFKDLLEVQRQQGGAGTSGDGKQTEYSKLVVPASVKSRNELMTFLLENGVLQNTKEFDELFALHSKNLPLK